MSGVGFGLGMAISAILNSNGAPSPAEFPDTDRIALWMANETDTSSYTTPNLWAATPHDGNYLKNPGHLAGSTAGGNWTTTNCTLTADQLGPDNQTSATRAVATAANGAVISTGQTIPAGTWTLVIPIKSNTGSSQVVRIGHSSTLTNFNASPSIWSEFAAVFELASPAGGLTLVRDDGSGTMDVLFGTPRLLAGDVSESYPGASPLAGHLTRGLSDQPVLAEGSSYWSFTNPTRFVPQWDVGLPFSTGAATFFHIVRTVSNPTTIKAIQGLRANGVTRHMFGLRGTGRLCHGDGYAQTKCQQAVKLADNGWQIIGVVVDPVANERRFYVGRQLVQILSGIGSNTSTTDRDFVIGVVSGGNGWEGDWIGGGIYGRALDESEWATLVSACENKIVEHGQVVGNTLNVDLFDGDSTYNDNQGNVDYWPSKSAASLSTGRLLINLGVPGDDIEDVDSRRTLRARYLTDTANRTYGLTFSATNNVENVGYPATYASVGQDIVNEAKADGFNYVIACTLTPKTQAGYNANRNTINTSIRAFTNVDAICDFAANTDIGDDADASDVAKYPDGSHPSDSTHVTMATIYAAANNGL